MRWALVPIRSCLGKLLRHGSSCGDPKAEAMCSNLLKLWPALLTLFFFINPQVAELVARLCFLTCLIDFNQKEEV